MTTAKCNQIPFWQEQAKSHGRGNSLLLFDENERFNFLDYLMSRHGTDGIGTVTETLLRIMDSAKHASATASQRGGEAFWEDTSRKGLRYGLPAIYSAKGSLLTATPISRASSPMRPRHEKRCSAGAPVGALVLFLLYATLILGWYAGSVAWWVALAAVGLAFRTLGAMAAPDADTSGGKPDGGRWEG